MDLSHVKTFEELKMEKHKFYGEGSPYKELQAKIRTAPNEEKQSIGKKLSEMKTEAETAFAKKVKELEDIEVQSKIDSQWIDVTEPVSKTNSLHPLTLVANRFKEWFTFNGFFESVGSEIESDEFNFERLNIPKDHPAREMQDSLYFNKESLLRTHNTGFTARELDENVNKAFKHFAIGSVYRNDEDDRTHSHQFTQADFVAVGHYSFPNLIWVLKSLLSYVLEKEVEIRLRPSYFPFTEPSVEVDILHNGNWLEVLGAGILHRNVFKEAGYTNDMNGIAGGIGIERIAMLKYNVKDIRDFYTNDLRFINQFKGGK